MQPFLSENFLLQTKSAQRLYHEYAAEMPVFDYHCHLPVAEIAGNKKFANLTAIWLNGDHYKWRAMRANGVDERYITGDASDEEKFMAWAGTVPKTLRNPLYHWTHLELKRFFGITDKVLDPTTARDIYAVCNGMLQEDDFSARALLERMRVKIVCTTDDPVDSLEHHQTIAVDPDFLIKVLPAFRPDRAMAVEDTAAFNSYVDQLAMVCAVDITSLDLFLSCLDKRHSFFHARGCRLSDHGLERPYAVPCSRQQAAAVFERIRSGKTLSQEDICLFKSFMLIELAVMDWERGWTQQYHFGALRNNNSRAFAALGPDTGYDSIGDFSMAKALATMLDTLASQGKLAKTILYILNPSDNEMIATMIGNFQDGSVPGKMQFGSGWWFNDQKDGMERQLNALSTMGLLSRFVGMLTDSRSFLSFPRHEYFRRILCNLFGTDMENGELPADFALIGATIQDICFHNAVNYLGINPE
ncbi:MAG: glucuronate isomerase [Deltaproteobacteria bacterium]|nr:MAG: glucuronate isomerase [Deltaproteobacteria bacterium]